MSENDQEWSCFMGRSIEGLTQLSTVRLAHPAASSQRSFSEKSSTIRLRRQ